jgi:hypothetical protein
MTYQVLLGCIHAGGSSGDDKVGYIRLSTFSSQTVPAFEEALSTLRKQVGIRVGPSGTPNQDELDAMSTC